VGLVIFSSYNPFGEKITKRKTSNPAAAVTGRFGQPATFSASSFSLCFTLSPPTSLSSLEACNYIISVTGHAVQYQHSAKSIFKDVLNLVMHV